MDNLAIFGAQYLYLILLLIALIWFFLQPRQNQKDMVAWGLVALPLMAVLLLVAGTVYFDPRPFVSDGITPLLPHAADNGFPSDHTLICSATASIVLFYNKWFSGLLWLLTGMVGFSRVYTGIHHTLDIVASAALALAVSTLVWAYILPTTRNLSFFSRT